LLVCLKAYNHSTWKAEAGGSQGCSLGYIVTSYLKTKQQQQKINARKVTKCQFFLMKSDTASMWHCLPNLNPSLLGWWNGSRDSVPA
jgi:hypothetical protein